MIAGEFFKQITEDAQTALQIQGDLLEGNIEQISDRAKNKYLDAVKRWRIDRQKMVAQFCAYSAQGMTPLTDEIEGCINSQPKAKE